MNCGSQGKPLLPNLIEAKSFVWPQQRGQEPRHNDGAKRVPNRASADVFLLLLGDALDEGGKDVR
eukprot:9527579-Prorocentrum_lima.AAC.1